MFGLSNNIIIFQALDQGQGEQDDSIQSPTFDTTNIRLGDALAASRRYAERESTSDDNEWPPSDWIDELSGESLPYVEPVPRPPMPFVTTYQLPDLDEHAPSLMLPGPSRRPSVEPSQPVASLEVHPGTPPLDALEAHAREMDITSSENSGQPDSDLFDTTPDLSETESLSPVISRRNNCDLASSQSSSSTEEEVVNAYRDFLNRDRPGRH